MRRFRSSRLFAWGVVALGCLFAVLLSSLAHGQCRLPLVTGYTGYGSSVAVSGDTVLVGSSNAVAVFGFDGIAWPLDQALGTDRVVLIP